MIEVRCENECCVERVEAKRYSVGIKTALGFLGRVIREELRLQVSRYRKKVKYNENTGTRANTGKEIFSSHVNRAAILGTCFKRETYKIAG